MGSIVGLQSEEILQVASEYEVKVNEWAGKKKMAADILFEFRSPIQRADLASTQPSDKVMGAQSHQRMVNTLQKQITVLERKMQEVLYMRAVCVICTYMDQNYAFFSH